MIAVVSFSRFNSPMALRVVTCHFAPASAAASEAFCARTRALATCCTSNTENITNDRIASTIITKISVWPRRRLRRIVADGMGRGVFIAGNAGSATPS
jgi:hypothetical protein